MSFLHPVSGRPDEVAADLAAWLAADEEPRPLVVETSGSTGAPKSVVLARSALLASVRGTERRLGASGRWLLTLPATYVAGLQVLARSLVSGRAPVPVEAHRDFAAAVDHARGLDPEGHLFVSVVPTQLHRMLGRPEQVAALRQMHTVLLGGGPVPAGLRERAATAGVRTVATYGMSETCGGCVYDGLPLEGVQVRLGARSRVLLRGPVLFDGYAGRPDLTAEVLDDGWFRTSDAGRLDQAGRLEVTGRVDDVVVSGGVNVPAPAVAGRLRAHPRVRAAEVLGVDDEEWGRRVVAFVVGPVALPELRDWVAGELPRSWAPRQLVSLEELPLLPNGKLDRVRLTEAAAGTVGP